MWEGMLATTWPFCTLEVGRDQLVFENKLLGRRHVLTHNDVVSIERKIYLPFVAWGIKLRNSKSGTPRNLRFWVINLDQMMNALKTSGWIVS